MSFIIVNFSLLSVRMSATIFVKKLLLKGGICYLGGFDHVAQIIIFQSHLHTYMTNLIAIARIWIVLLLLHYKLIQEQSQSVFNLFLINICTTIKID